MIQKVVLHQGQGPYLLIDLSGKLVPKEYWSYRSVCRAIRRKAPNYSDRTFMVLNDLGSCLCETEWRTEKVFPNRTVSVVEITFKHETQE